MTFEDTSVGDAVRGNPANALLLKRNQLLIDLTVTTVEPTPLDGRRAGGHLDIGERILDLGSTLPAGSMIKLDAFYDGRIRRGSPFVIVHRHSGTIISWTYGTEYALNLSEQPFAEARAAGGSRLMKWSDWRTEDLRDTHGPMWLWGRFDASEARWLSATFDSLDASA